MATAEYITDAASSNVTASVTPLAVRNLQGSAQRFEIDATAPVFFAPGSGKTDLFLSVWPDLSQGTVEGYYTFAPEWGTLTIVPERQGASEWDGLGLDLMLIASLDKNWDGEGAKPVSSNSVATALDLLALARKAAQQFQVSAFCTPALRATVDGGVALTWTRGKKELKCTVYGKVVEVVRWSSPDRYESDDFWDIPVQEVAEHFEWLLQ